MDISFQIHAFKRQAMPLFPGRRGPVFPGNKPKEAIRRCLRIDLDSTSWPVHNLQYCSLIRLKTAAR